jgi:outer membrane immunogenic protein
MTSAAFAALLAGPALAADLYVPPPVFAPAAVANWDGFYAGLHVGYGSGTLSTALGDFDGDGALVGVQVGYNANLGAFVLGAEGDVAWTGVTGTEGVQEYSLNWLASLRGRIGLPVEGVLFYATAGLSAAGGEHFGGITTQSATHVGWVAGAGVEAMVTEAVSLKAEYLYYGLGEATYNFTPPVDFELNIHTVKIGANFHF